MNNLGNVFFTATVFYFSLLIHLCLQKVPIQDLWCVAAKDMLLEFIAKMDLPKRYVLYVRYAIVLTYVSVAVYA